MKTQHWQKRHWIVLGIAAALLLAAPWLWFWTLSLLFPFPWGNLQRPPAVVVTDRHGQPLRFFLPADQRWRLPVRLADLPPELPRALVASEDRRFYRHPGVDPVAVMRAAWSNVRSREVVSGASTISMQVARMADPGARTLISKGFTFVVNRITRRRLIGGYRKLAICAIVLTNSATIAG